MATPSEIYRTPSLRYFLSLMEGYDINAMTDEEVKLAADTYPLELVRDAQFRGYIS